MDCVFLNYFRDECAEGWVFLNYFRDESVRMGCVFFNYFGDESVRMECVFLSYFRDEYSMSGVGCVFFRYFWWMTGVFLYVPGWIVSFSIISGMSVSGRGVFCFSLNYFGDECIRVGGVFLSIILRMSASGWGVFFSVI